MRSYGRTPDVPLLLSAHEGDLESTHLLSAHEGDLESTQLDALGQIYCPSMEFAYKTDSTTEAGEVVRVLY